MRRNPTRVEIAASRKLVRLAYSDSRQQKKRRLMKRAFANISRTTLTRSESGQVSFTMPRKNRRRVAWATAKRQIREAKA